MRVLWAGLVFVAVASAAATNQRAVAHDHYFNLEYDEAISAYEKVLDAEPDDPTVYNHLATAVLYRELNRLGMLETSAFRGDNQFFERPKLKPDPRVKRDVFKYLEQGRQLATKRLKANPADQLALLAISHNYGLRANYEFMVEKAYFGALRNGNRARGFSNRLQKHHPEFVDGYLVAGVQEYVVGSLPWAVRALVAFGGVRGDKAKGEAMVARVAREGDFARNEARVLMVLVHRREGRPLEAVKILESYLEDFPRNYVLELEMASMYLDAGQKSNALDVFRDVYKKYEADEQGFGRMPARIVKALERRIEKLEAEEPARVQLAVF